jgi:hypothetical protein
MNIMDHEQAVKMHAAERYLLDELSPEERSDFEEHYFLCLECADEVRSVFTFADNATAVMQDEARTVRRATVRQRRSSNWWAWLWPAYAAPVAAGLLLALTVYQSALVIPGLKRDLADATQARVIPSSVARPATRGDDPVVEVSSQDVFVQLTLDINPVAPVSSYSCEVSDQSGSLEFSVPAKVSAGTGSLNLLLPVSRLKPGRHVIRLKTGSSTEPNTEEYSFVLKPI